MQWFCNGDMGRFHSDGCFEIIECKKDIVKFQHGQYVSLGNTLTILTKIFQLCKSSNIFLASTSQEIFFVQVEATLKMCHYLENIILHENPFHIYCVVFVIPSD